MAIIWAFAALLIFTFLPLFEGRALIKKIVSGVLSGSKGREERREESTQRQDDEITVERPGASVLSSTGSVEKHVQPQ